MRDKVHGGASLVAREQHLCYRRSLPSDKKLGGALMLVTGEVDNVVDPSTTMRMASALIDAHKDFDLVIIPKYGHFMKGIEWLAFSSKEVWPLPRLYQATLILRPGLTIVWIFSHAQTIRAPRSVKKTHRQY